MNLKSKIRKDLLFFIKKFFFKKNTPLPPCVACNVVKTLRHNANKNPGVVQLRIRAYSSYQSPGIPGACGGNKNTCYNVPLKLWYIPT